MSESRTNPPSPCQVETYSSRACELGTKGCIVRHWEQHTPSPSLHEEHIRRARTWWNLQDYRQTPEASVEGIATLLDEAYDLGQRMGHPRPPTDGYRAAMWDDAIEDAALEAERMIVEFSEIDVVDSAPEKERIARRIRALRSKYAEPATSEDKPAKVPINEPDPLTCIHGMFHREPCEQCETEVQQTSEPLRGHPDDRLDPNDYVFRNAKPGEVVGGVSAITLHTGVGVGTFPGLGKWLREWWTDDCLEEMEYELAQIIEKTVQERLAQRTAEPKDKT